MTTEQQQTPRVTQKDVAKRAGVAVSSVSYVLNNGPRPVSAETRARVLKAIDELGYRPNEHARRLIQQNWGSEKAPRQFGILLSGGARVLIARPFYSTLLVGLFDEAVQHNYAVRFIHLYDEIQDPILFNELIHPETIAGLVLIHIKPPLSRDQELLARIRERVANVICLDSSCLGLPSITFDKLDAGQRATTYLIEMGHRRIGFIGNHDGRFDGYLQSLRVHNLPFDPQLVTSEQLATQDEITNSPQGGWLGAKGLLNLSTPPTAILAASDEVAIGALRAAREHHMSVPEDLSIVGVDDIDLASYSSPPLTTVRVPKNDMAKLTVQTLIDRVNNPNGMSVNMVLPVELIVRGSSGPTPSISS